MKKRIKIKKFILSCFTAFCLGFGLVSPFIDNNDDFVVSALSESTITSTYNGFTFTQPFKTLDGTENFVEKYISPIESANNLQSLDGNTLIEFGFTTFDLFTTGGNFCYYFDNADFGVSYGFSVTSVSGFFNGFYFVLDTSSNSYDIYLADITYNSSNAPLISNEYLLDTNDTYYFVYSSSDDISIKSYGLTSNVGVFNSWFYNDFITYHNGNYNMSKWHSGNVVALNFAYYQAYVDYFNIERTLTNSDNKFSFSTDGTVVMNNLLSMSGVVSTNVYQLVSSDKFYFSNMSLNELSFIYSILNINFYPSFSSITITAIPTYYRLNKLNNAYLGVSLNNARMRFVDLNGENTISFNAINVNSDTGNITNNYDITSNLMYNKYTRDWYSPYSNSNNYFQIINLLNSSETSSTLNSLLYIGTAYDLLPQRVKGWYTFDIAPFDNITESIDIDLDISFTADSHGYNNLRITSGTVQGTYVGRVYYRNLDSDRNVINEYVPYQYSRIPYESDWTTYNARQLFFDETLIDGNVYNSLNDMGVFTFISNNPNNNQTMVDLFWGIAEVPIVTVRKVFDFEILGTNVTNFIMSMITISIILFLIRRLF